MKPDGRTKILDAALSVIRTKGFEATRVEDVCAAAGVSKGAFFHHFAGKEALAIAAADHWSAVTGGFFETADFHALADPVDRILAYLDLRIALVEGGELPFSCLAGTMAQETFVTRPAVAEACGRSIRGHAESLVADIAEARAARAPDSDWTAESLALHTQAVIQGAFVVAKAGGGAISAVENLRHLKRYVAMLFGRTAPTAGGKS